MGKLSERLDAKSFRTARCKIYPPRLNQVLAEAIVVRTKEVYAGTRPTATLPQDLCPYIHTDFVEDEAVQPDYHHQAVQV